jgi:hypothetical protein
MREKRRRKEKESPEADNRASETREAAVDIRLHLEI